MKQTDILHRLHPFMLRLYKQAKQGFAMLLAIALLLPMIPMSAFALATPTEITTVADLVAFQQTVAEHPDTDAVLTADIDMSSVSGWSGIGTEEIPYSGDFSGDGHTIIHLSGSQGLFAVSSGNVQNVYLKDVNINGVVNVGAVVGKNTGTVFNCASTGTVNGSSWSIGGIVGWNHNGSVNGCFSACSVTGGTAGGLIGSNCDTGTLQYCYYEGTNETLEGDSDYGKASSIHVYSQSGDTYTLYNTGATETKENVLSILNTYITENNGHLPLTFSTGIVSFAANHSYAAGTMESEAAYGGYTIPECTFKLPGASFTSWNTNPDGTGLIYPAGGSMQVTEDITLYAQWDLEPAKQPTIEGISDDLALTYGQIDSTHRISVTASAPVPTQVNETYALSYQWYKNTADSTEGAQKINGATEASYTVPADTGAGNLWYYCMVTATRNNGETANVTSSAIKVTTAKATLTADQFTFTAPSSLTYNGNQKAATIEARPTFPGVGAITVKYYDANGSLLDNAPVYPGTYTVKIDVAEGANYAGAQDISDSNWTFTISYLPADFDLLDIQGAAYKAGAVYWFAENGLVQVLPASGYYIATTPYDPFSQSVTLSRQSALNVYLQNDAGEKTGSLDLSDIVKFDGTAPIAEIQIQENKWSTFWNNLTFDLLYNQPQDVTITATDMDSGVQAIEYYLADYELSYEEVIAITEWESYNGTFQISPNNRHIVYAKITDCVGNVTYVNSDGILLDDIAPTLEGIEDGKTYYGDLIVIKPEDQFFAIRRVTCDGEAMGFAEGTYGLIPADNKQHTVVVEDHAGNKTTYTVTVMTNYTVCFDANGGKGTMTDMSFAYDQAQKLSANTFTREGYTFMGWNTKADCTGAAFVDELLVGNLTDENNDIVTLYAMWVINRYAVIYTVDGEILTIETVEHGKDASLPAIPEKAGYDETAPKWDHDGKNITANTIITAVYTKNQSMDDGEVVPPEESTPPTTAAPGEPSPGGSVPTETTPPNKTPATGDTSTLGLWIFAMIMSASALVVLFGTQKKRKST